MITTELVVPLILNAPGKESLLFHCNMLKWGGHLIRVRLGNRVRS